MLPHPGFKIPDTFLQLRDRCPEVNVHRPEVNVHRPEVNDRCPLLGDCQLQLSNGCLQHGYHGRHHSTERAAKPTRHPTPVNGYHAEVAGFWVGDGARHG